MVYTKTFIQVLSTMLPDHAIINCLNKKIPTYLNFDAILQDLRELRKVFMEYLDGQIMIPRKQWNSTRSKLVSIFNYKILILLKYDKSYLRYSLL
jgi:hypothetical protein